MVKIIGFLITTENITPKIDFFNTGLKQITIKHYGYNIFFWGIGNIRSYKINEKHCLSFPLNDSLFDRNVLIGFKNGSIIIENDWLGSIPVFYNPKEKIISTVSNFCQKDKKLHLEGLSNFCEFGYSVFEQTIFEDVKFMRYFSKLIILEDTIRIEHKNDPVMERSFLKEVSNEDDVIDLMQNYISNIESKLSGDLVLPTSGGYDSRLLTSLVKDKSRIRSFTYGTCKDQSQSSEVVHAKKLSDIYSTKWEQVELRDILNYISKWVEIYGFSTHLHGMYHIEFYNEILKRHKFNKPSFLSGIFGDVWAGSIKYENIEKYEDVIKLGYTHGRNVDPKYLEIITDNELKKQYYKTNKEYFKNDKLKAVFTIRMKLILISYLTQIPEYFGMPVWTPFLNFEIVKATLNIPEDRRKNRIWESEYFRKVGLNLEGLNLKSIRGNRLEDEIAKNITIDPLDINIMKQYIQKERLKTINTLLAKFSIYESLKNQLFDIRKVGGVLRKLGFKNEILKAILEYYVIKSIEIALKS